MASFIGKFFSLLSGSPKHGDSDTAKSPYMPVEKSPLDFTFAEAFTQSGGYFIYCNNKQDVIDQLRNVGLESGEQALRMLCITGHKVQACLSSKTTP
jgi:hypothetical protein